MPLCYDKLAESTPSGSHQLNWNSVLRLIKSKSIFSLTCFMLLLIFSFWQPADLHSFLGFLGNENSPSLAKLPDFFASDVRPNILLLGSSLVSRAVARSDDLAKGINPRFDLWYTEVAMARYPKAEFLGSLIDASGKCSAKNSIANLTVYGAQASDDYFLLKKCLDRKLCPKLMICGVAPRDFMSNDNPQVEDSAVVHLICDPIDVVLAPAANQDFQKTCWRRFKLLNSLIRQRFSALFKPLVTDPQKGFAYKDEPCYTAKKNKFPDLWLYSFRYNPPDFRRMAVQFVYFDQLLRLAYENGVRVVVVDMPLTKQNIALIRSDVIADYRDRLQNICKDRNASYFDLHSICSPDEFEDSCHLNAAGGKRLLQSIVARLAFRTNRAGTNEQSQL